MRICSTDAANTMQAWPTVVPTHKPNLCFVRKNDYYYIDKDSYFDDYKVLTNLTSQYLTHVMHT